MIIPNENPQIMSNIDAGVASTTQAEGLPTPSQKVAERVAAVNNAKAQAEAHLAHLSQAASDRIHTETDMWQPENPGKPEEQPNLKTIVGDGVPVTGLFQK
jgi:uncharacterized protein (DUF4415 family)